MGPENTPHPTQFRVNKFIYIYIYIYIYIFAFWGEWVIACC